MAVNKSTEESLKKKGEKAKIPLSVLIKVYERGQAAWLTGSRPGIGMNQWASARVNSFIKNVTSAGLKHDTDLVKKVKEYRKKLKMRS